LAFYERKLLEHQEKDKIAFYKALKDRGWHLEDNRLYPPNGTFWIEGNADLPLHMIERMYKKTKDILEKIPQSEHLFSDKEFQNRVKEDMESEVTVLKELLDKKQNT
jgi:hypothetical protein